MAQASGNTTTKTGNGLGDWVKLSPGANRVTVEAVTWGGASAGLRYSPDGTDAREFTIKDDVGGAEVVATENEGYDLNGPGWITIDVSSTGGTPKTLTVERITPVLGPR